MGNPIDAVCCILDCASRCPPIGGCGGGPSSSKAPSSGKVSDKELKAIAGHKRLTTCTKIVLGVLGAVVAIGLAVASYVVFQGDIGYHADGSFNEIGRTLAFVDIFLPMVVAAGAFFINSSRQERRVRKERMMQVMEMEKPEGYGILAEAMRDGKAIYSKSETATLRGLYERAERVSHFQEVTGSRDDFAASVETHARKGALLYERLRTEQRDEGYETRLASKKPTPADREKMHNDEQTISSTLNLLTNRLRLMGYDRLADRVLRRETVGYSNRDWAILETLAWTDDQQQPDPATIEAATRAIRDVQLHDLLQSEASKESRSSALGLRIRNRGEEEIPYFESLILTLRDEIPRDFFADLGDALQDAGYHNLADRIGKRESNYTPAEWQILRRFAASLLPQEEE